MNKLSRRDFLKFGAYGLGSVYLRPWLKWAQLKSDWPDAERMGRVCKGKVSVRSKPLVDGTVVKEIYDDAIVVWLRDVVGENPGVGSSVWAETPDGYIYAPRIQPVAYRPNQPVAALPESSLGKGMWVEVTVPYVNLVIGNPPVRAKGFDLLRFYYGQVLWVDDMKTGDDGTILYQVHERYGYGDLFWAPAEAFRPITEEEIAPISPDVEDKVIQVDLNYQTLTAYENKKEVFFCTISSGGKYDKDGNPSDTWSTPVGPHPISRKLVSLYMSGPVTGNWSGVAWTSIIAAGGVAVHSCYWHNDFGVPRSHGCINLRSEDAKWVFRWTLPHVSLYPGEIDISDKWPPAGSVVEVSE
jgi:lipoprotein-anchoring transpeptidase ErfK/SrfK